jgi:hypothetical protein
MERLLLESEETRQPLIYENFITDTQKPVLIIYTVCFNTNNAAVSQ